MQSSASKFIHAAGNNNTTQCNERTVSLIVKFRKGEPSNSGEGVVVAAQLLGNPLVGGVLLGIGIVSTGCIAIVRCRCRRRRRNDHPGRTLVGRGRVGQIEIEVKGREGTTG